MNETIEGVRLDRPTTHVAVVTINRPQKRNALNLNIKAQLADLIDALGGDDDLRSIVLTGTDKYFVSGTDLAEMVGMTPDDHLRLRTDRIFTSLRTCKKVLIAAVEGFALGGGCELALSCDMIIAARSARFGQPEIKVGIMPGAGGTQRLARILGRYRAMRLLLTGDSLSAAEAFSLGLVSDLAPDGGALETAVSLAKAVAAMPPLAVSAIKDVVMRGLDEPLESALAMERRAFVELFNSLDQKEGMTAFLERRAPMFRGR